MVGIISCGLLLLVYGESNFNPLGFAVVMTASMLSGLRWTITQVLLQGTPGSSGHGASGGPVEVLLQLTPGAPHAHYCHTGLLQPRCSLQWYCLLLKELQAKGYCDIFSYIFLFFNLVYMVTQANRNHTGMLQWHWLAAVSQTESHGSCTGLLQSY